MSKKKRVLFIILLLFLILVGSGVGYYFYSMSPVSNDTNKITYELKAGTSKLQVAKDLEGLGLIKSELGLKVYLFFNSDVNLQAGVYEFQKNMSPKTMITMMNNGTVRNQTINVTLVEGKRLNEYVKTLSSKLKITESDLLDKLSDQDYLKTLIEKYWFLESTILNEEIYFPLEGYLFPETYAFYENSTAENIIEKILDVTEQKLDSLKEQIEASKYSVHEILSMAAIIELEAVTESDRAMVSQVIYKRLSSNKGLGMDVTTVYAVKKNMGDGLTLSDLKTNSPYNTSEMNSSMIGRIPVGPICNPSLMSIKSVLNPSNTNYMYFFADIKTGKVYFSNTYEEHQNVIKELGE